MLKNCIVRYNLPDMHARPVVNPAAPTEEFYGLLTRAFDHFNQVLFEGKLPKCLLTVQREKNTMGFFSADRWANSNGKRTHEIAVNPAYFARHKLIEVLQTLVHEQCHLWQFEFGKPSRAGYHNKEWATKMQSIGLMPSHNGERNGHRTGQKMSDYPLKDGLFIQACKTLIAQGYQLTWIDRFTAVRESCQSRCIDESIICPQESDIEKILNAQVADIIPDIEPIETTAEQKSAKAKTKYTCAGCAVNLWGKPELNIVCGDCNLAFAQQ